MTTEFDEMCRCRESYDQAKSAFEQANTRLYFARRNYDEAHAKWAVASKQSSGLETSPVLDHRFIPDGMDPGICQKCSATRASHRQETKVKCQHDLLQPEPTVVLHGVGDDYCIWRCTECQEQWKLPQSTALNR